MSGRRPLHLTRRGAVYAVRFRIPSDLVVALGVAELRRSLFTSDSVVARRRCKEASSWFTGLMEVYRHVKSPNRQDFEDAARRYFDRLSRDLDRPRGFSSDRLDEEVAEQIEHSQARIEDLNEQLIRNDFDPTVINEARMLVALIGLNFDELTDVRSQYAQKLAARAQREFQLRNIGSLQGITGQPSFDTLFSRPVVPNGMHALPQAYGLLPHLPLDTPKPTTLHSDP